MKAIERDALTQGNKILCNVSNQCSLNSKFNLGLSEPTEKLGHDGPGLYQRCHKCQHEEIYDWGWGEGGGVGYYSDSVLW